MSSNVDVVVRQLADQGFSVQTNAPFGELTTYGVGGRCAALVEISGGAMSETLAGIVSRHNGLPTFVLGNGSNTLVADAGFDGLVIRLVAPRDPDAMRVVVVDGMITVDAWMPLPVLARRSVAAGACGLEWAVGVPGTVGGAVRMNAGGHGAEIVDNLDSARVVSLRSGRATDVPASELGLHFRGSALAPWHLVASARFAVSPPDGHDCAGEISEIVAWRREHQPGGRNAGSVFVNPAPGQGSSGALIDAAGLRGFTVGGASVSEKHANFIQATPGSRSSDVVAVMSGVQEAVQKATGVVLRSEVKLVGFDAETERQFADGGHESAGIEGLRLALCAQLGETR